MSGWEEGNWTPDKDVEAPVGKPLTDNCTGSENPPMPVSDNEYITKPVAGATCEDGEMDSAKSPTLNGMGMCAVTRLSVKTAVGK
jgi:hypothetical protein